MYKCYNPHLLYIYISILILLWHFYLLNRLDKHKRRCEEYHSSKKNLCLATREKAMVSRVTIPDLLARGIFPINRSVLDVNVCDL